MSEKRRGLGRGLGALIPSAPASEEHNTAASAAAPEPATKPRPAATSTPGKAPGKRSSESSRSTEPAEGNSTTSSAKRETEGRSSKTTKKTEGAVSRETLAPQKSGTRSTKGSTQPRRDMGQALRSTTSVRRPVDMFFLSSADQEGLKGHEVTDATPDATTPTSAKTHVESSTSGDVSRETGIDSDALTRTAQDSEKAAHGPESKPERTPPQVALREPSDSQDAAQSHDDAEANRELSAVPGARFASIPVTDIHPNRKQPRQVFDEEELEELAFSVKELGVLQPVVVRPSREAGDKYELVMGERRWRAVQRAGLETVPAIVRETSDDDLLRDALLENLHRSQLNPLEEAAAYQQLLEEFGATQEELSRRIGRSRPQISNTLRLLRLPALVQRRVAAGVLSSGHARALLGLSDLAEMERLAQRIVAEGMSVRATEEAVALSAGVKRHASKRASVSHRHEDRLNYIADAFSDRLDTSVKIQLGARKGKMTIEFATVEDLNRILDVLDPKMTGKD